MWVDTSQLLALCLLRGGLWFALTLVQEPELKLQPWPLRWELYLLCHLFFSFSVSDSRQQNLIRAFSPMPINSNPIPPQCRKDEENNYDIPGIKSLVMSVSLLWKYDLLRYKLWDLLSVCSHVITAVVFTGSHFVQRLSANWSSMSLAPVRDRHRPTRSRETCTRLMARKRCVCLVCAYR